jgi:ABC-type microcin C transport system permease subunit YejE
MHVSSMTRSSLYGFTTTLLAVIVGLFIGGKPGLYTAAVMTAAFWLAPLINRPLAYWIWRKK